ncbi:MAG: EAL domain-containing response regulator [Deltaproteobacteria bacterium]|nr:EAL domain-containing response regulator [Deltaproteobacteria bacterium]
MQRWRLRRLSTGQRLVQLFQPYCLTSKRRQPSIAARFLLFCGHAGALGLGHAKLLEAVDLVATYIATLYIFDEVAFGVRYMSLRRIMLLDDESTVLNVLSDYLAHPSLEITTCQEIEAAEAMLEQGRFAVVVTDLRVSELGGLEGMRLIRYVSTHFPETVVLAMSGYVNDDVHAIGRAVGAHAILEKPLDLRLLRRYVHGEEGLPDIDGDETVQSVELLDDFLAKKQIKALLQPIVELDTGGPPFLVHSYESLARAPMGTPLRNPEILFSYAAKKERLYQTDMQCIKAALEEATGLYEGEKLFINTQPRSMTNPDFFPEVQKLVDESRFDTKEIVFELTEQQTIVNPQAFSRTLDAMRDHGFGCALDDYGVGFANLQLIQDLKPDYIKLSGFFCKGLIEDPFKQTLVRATAAMCNEIGIPTVLENIETQEDLDIVNTLGITYGQGYFFAPPDTAANHLGSGRFYGPENKPS